MSFGESSSLLRPIILSSAHNSLVLPTLNNYPNSSSNFHDRRDGETIHVLANELVPGDLVQFSTGDRIPADIRITDAVDLEIDESSLTGETTARRKSSETCAYVNDGRGGQPGEPVALADRSCIAYMGTLVRNGTYSFG